MLQMYPHGVLEPGGMKNHVGDSDMHMEFVHGSSPARISCALAFSGPQSSMPQLLSVARTRASAQAPLAISESFVATANSCTCGAQLGSRRGELMGLAEGPTRGRPSSAMLGDPQGAGCLKPPPRLPGAAPISRHRARWCGLGHCPELMRPSLQARACTRAFVS